MQKKERDAEFNPTYNQFNPEGKTRKGDTPAEKPPAAVRTFGLLGSRPQSPYLGGGEP